MTFTKTDTQCLDHKDHLFQRLAWMTESTWLLMACVAEQQDQPRWATSCYLHALSNNPTSQDALKGLSRLGASDWELTSSELLKVLISHSRPGSLRQGALWRTQIWLLLAKIRHQTNQTIEMHQALQQAILAAPNQRNGELWCAIGDVLDDHGCLELARFAYQNILDRDPKGAAGDLARFRLGIVYRKQQKPFLAMELLKGLLTDSVNRHLSRGRMSIPPIDIMFEIGLAYEVDKQLKNAIHTYMDILRESRNNTKVMLQLGWLHGHQRSDRHFQLALEFFEQALEIVPNDSMGWVRFARVLGQRGIDIRAFGALDNSLKSDPKNTFAWCELGYLYYSHNQLTESFDAYRRALDIDRNIGEAWYAIGVLYARSRQPSEAVAALEIADGLNTHPYISKQLALARRQTNGFIGSKPSLIMIDLIHPLMNKKIPALPDLTIPASTA